MTEVEPPEQPPSDPVEEAIGEIEGVSDEELRGFVRLGTLAFNEADVTNLREIASILRDTTQENQSYWDGSFRGSITSKAQEVLDVVRRVKGLQADAPDAGGERNRLRDEINAHLQWLRDNVVPRLFDKRMREHLAGARPPTEREAQRQADLAKQGDELQARFEQLAARLTEMEPVVEAQRATAAVTGAEDLSVEYMNQATRHESGWKLWLWVLLGTGVVAVLGGIALLAWNRPTGSDIDGETLARLALDLFVIGLLLYAVRVSALQFRVHRHLEAKARSKAAALSTFSRFVASGAEPSTRDVLAATLAQAVFESGDTGFVDSSSDQITLIERIVGPAAQRVSGETRGS